MECVMTFAVLYVDHVANSNALMRTLRYIELSLIHLFKTEQSKS